MRRVLRESVVEGSVATESVLLGGVPPYRGPDAICNVCGVLRQLKKLNQEESNAQTSLMARARDAIEEGRIVLPGIQAFAVFNQRFTRLSEEET